MHTSHNQRDDQAQMLESYVEIVQCIFRDSVDTGITLILVFAVEALALRTEFEIFGTATISTVPATATIIVTVVTVVVAFVLRFCTRFFALL